MSLAAGTRLGPYEIASPIAAGGMGEVLPRQRHAPLARRSHQVLPAEFARDAQLRARVEREAKAISSLNHPNICMLFDVGTQNDLEYLVMEYLDGEPLTERLARGPLPVSDVLRQGIEIADALDKAHRTGIIHRDLKPDNVILTRSGSKLLVFGVNPVSSSDYDLAPDGRSSRMEEKRIRRRWSRIGGEAAVPARCHH